MTRLSRLHRLLVGALAIAQMAVPAIVAIADADLAARAGGAEQVHIEDHTRRNCRPEHPDSCALCQLLSHLSPQRASALLVPATSTDRPATCDDAARLATSFTRARERTRAPPVG